MLTLIPLRSINVRIRYTPHLSMKLITSFNFPSSSMKFPHHFFPLKNSLRLVIFRTHYFRTRDTTRVTKADHLSCCWVTGIRGENILPLTLKLCGSGHFYVPIARPWTTLCQKVLGTEEGWSRSRVIVLFMSKFGQFCL